MNPNDETPTEELDKIYEEGIAKIDDILVEYKKRIAEHLETFRRERIEELQKELQS